MTWKQQLKAERKRLNVSQSGLADLLQSCPVSTVQDWELGRRVPPEWIQRLILAYLSARKASRRNHDPQHPPRFD